MITLHRVNAFLAIILVVLTLASLLLPAIQRVRRAAARTDTVNHVRQMTFAMQSYHDAYKRLPPACDSHPALSRNDPVSIHVHLLPYVDQKELFKTFLSEDRGETNATVPLFIAPVDGSLDDPAAVQNFAANLRVFSDKGGQTPSAKDMPPLARTEPGTRTLIGITRGASNTIAFATKLAHCGEGGSRYAADPTSPFGAYFGQNAARTTAHYSNPQATYQWAPRGEECLGSPLMAQTYLPAPIITSFADGTARIMPGNIEPGMWNAFLHPSDLDE